jgi:hypothetical protein
MEDMMMNFASSSAIAKSKIDAPSFNATIVLSSLALLGVLVLALYLASGTPGTTLDELAFMAAFP